MTIDTYEPADNKNTEEYRSNLLIIVDRLKNKKSQIFNDLYGSGGVSSGTWQLLAIVSGIALFLVLIFNDSNTRETYFGISIIGLIVGIYQTKVRSKEENVLSYRLEGIERQIKRAQEAYNYALKHKDKEQIYTNPPGSIAGKKLYD